MAEGTGELDAGSRRLLIGMLAPLALATLVGLVLLWPAHRSYPLPVQYAGPGGTKATFVVGKVAKVQNERCSGSQARQCSLVTVRLDRGPEKGTSTRLEYGHGPGLPELRTGERVRLAKVPDPQTGAPTYLYDDLVRDVPLSLLAALFVVVVIAVARWRGAAALAGLLLTYAVIVYFVLPALLGGESPLLVGLTAGSTILFMVLYLAHGPSARTSTALLGTLTSLLLAALLAAAVTASMHLTGLSSDVAGVLQTSAPAVSFTGLILCGVVIGALGVLNDVTVTQASAVWELHDADPHAGGRQLYRSAMRIGRDHIASSVYTLVLACAGSALPLLLLVSLSQRSLHDVITGDEIGAEVLRTMAGSVGLVASVPITTALAAYLVTRGRRYPSAYPG